MMVLFFTNGCSHSIINGEGTGVIVENLEHYAGKDRMSQDEIEYFFVEQINKYPYLNFGYSKNCLGRRTKYIVLETRKYPADCIYPIKIILLPSDQTKNCTEINLHTINSFNPYSNSISFGLYCDYIEITSVLQKDTSIWMRGLIDSGYKIILTGYL